MHQLTIIEITIILLGEAALMLDLGNRVFGSYARTPIRALTRITIISLLGVLWLLPLAAHFIAPMPMLLHASTILSAIVIVHFIYPLRFGITKRVDLDRPDRVSQLATGIDLRQTQITLPSLPAHADPLHLLVISDTHVNDQVTFDQLRYALNAIDSQTIDLIFMLGDFGENARFLSQTIDLLNELTDKYKVFVVLGNHDYEAGCSTQIKQFISQSGLQQLHNTAINLESLPITLMATDCPWDDSPASLLPPDPAERFTIALSHTPDNIRWLNRCGADLILAGHTHGGWLRLPAIGPLMLPSFFGRLMQAGWYQYNQTFMHGLPPEI